MNGIRAALKKDLISFLKSENADIVCFQEIKANEIDIDVKLFEELGYQCYWHSAEKKGYSGVGILTKMPPKEIQPGMGVPKFDMEGRTMIAFYENFVLVNTYFPSGTSGQERQDVKYQFLDAYLPFIEGLKSKNPNIIVLGDYNIAHTEIDIHNPKTNQKTSGFLPEERAWMTQWFNSGMLDSLRIIHPDTPHMYSWWTARFPSARLENKGWRIDYISISSPLKDQLKNASIHPDAKHSDHCPISVELAL